MDLSDLPGISAFAAVGGLLTDLLFYGGDIILAAGFGILSSVDLWIPLLSYLSRLAEFVPWLPEEIIETAIPVVLSIVTIVYAIRIINRIRSNTND